MKLRKSCLLITSGMLAAVLSFAAVAAPPGLTSNPEGIKPVPGSVSLVRSSNGLFLWGNSGGKSLASDTHIVMAPSKNISCSATAGCVVLITVMAQVNSSSTANQWGLDPLVDGQDINPSGGPILGDSQSSEFDTRSLTGTVQVSKGSHSVKTEIVAFGTEATLYSWSESVQVLP